ncbi:hypothetical protein DFQ28_004518 [Apophysomyces sp. BC1034]|nr:hypothetical protein DFQ28_004518 [Apophysomyces sp. BC1034]
MPTKESMRMPSLCSTGVTPPSGERSGPAHGAAQTASAAASERHAHSVLGGLQRRGSSVAGVDEAARAWRDPLIQQLDVSFHIGWHPFYDASWTEAARGPDSDWHPTDAQGVDAASRLPSVVSLSHDDPLPPPSARYLAKHGVPLSDLRLDPDVASNGDARAPDVLTHDNLRALVRSLAQRCGRRQLHAMLQAAKAAESCASPTACAPDSAGGATHRSPLARAFQRYVYPRTATAGLREAVCEYAPKFGDPAPTGRASDKTLKAMLRAAAIDARLPMNLAEFALLPNVLTEGLRQQAKDAGAMMAFPLRRGGADANASEAHEVDAALADLRANGTISEDQYIVSVNRLASLFGYEVARYRDTA